MRDEFQQGSGMGMCFEFIHLSFPEMRRRNKHCADIRRKGEEMITVSWKRGCEIPAIRIWKSESW